MTGNDYQVLAMRTANRGLSLRDQLSVSGLGLTGEAGEVADLIKKHIGQGHPLDTDDVLDECGDVLWYIAHTLDAVGRTMDECMEHNIAKLKARYPEGFDADHSIHRVV